MTGWTVAVFVGAFVTGIAMVGTSILALGDPYLEAKWRLRAVRAGLTVGYIAALTMMVGSIGTYLST